MKGTNLGEFEELVLLTVGILNDEAYSIAIAREIKKVTKRNVNFVVVHSALNRLEEKGYLESRLDGATNERGGRRKLLFRVTKSGQKALANSREMRNDLWKAIPKAAFNVAMS